MKVVFLHFAMILTTFLFAEDAACEEQVLQICTFDKVCASFDEENHVKDCQSVEPPRVFEFCSANKINPLEQPNVIISEHKDSLSNSSQPHANTDYTVTEHTIKNESLTIAWTVSDGPEGAEQSHLMGVALLMGVAFLFTSNGPISFEQLKREGPPVPVYTGLCFPKIIQRCEVPD